MDLDLEQGRRTYLRELPRLRTSKRNFVLIFGNDVICTFDSYLDAVANGRRMFSPYPFLVERIERED